MVLMAQKMFFDPPKIPGSGCLILGAIALGWAALAGCGPPDAGGLRGDGRPRVVATTTVVADLVRQVGGERVIVECLMPPGIDPHSYKATPRDAERLLRADLVVASGLHLEGRLAALLEKLADRVPFVAVADRLPADRLSRFRLGRSSTSPATAPPPACGRRSRFPASPSPPACPV
jgi:hypothetical protein